MNGGIIGKRNTSIKGLWPPNDILNDTNNIAKRPIYIDACDATTGWMVTDAGRSVALLTSGQHSGTGWFTLVKTNTADAWVATSKFVGLNLTGKSLGVWFYVKDATALGKISNVNLNLMNDLATPTSYRTWWAKHSFTSLTTGWQMLEYPVDSFTTSLGTPNFAHCPLLAIGVDTVAANRTFASGDIGFDDVFYRRV